MCDHTQTILTEEGYECLLCGKVLGHSYRKPRCPCCGGSAITGPSPAMMEDDDDRVVCTTCGRRFLRL